jgi:hypothetical protein
MELDEGSLDMMAPVERDTLLENHTFAMSRAQAGVVLHEINRFYVAQATPPTGAIEDGPSPGLEAMKVIYPHYVAFVSAPPDGAREAELHMQELIWRGHLRTPAPGVDAILRGYASSNPPPAPGPVSMATAGAFMGAMVDAYLRHGPAEGPGEYKGTKSPIYVALTSFEQWFRARAAEPGFDAFLDEAVGVVSPPPTAAPAAAPSGLPAPAAGAALFLRSGGGELRLGITTKLASRLLRSLGEDARFWDNNVQCTVEKRADGWYLVPGPSTPNETLLDGRLVTSAVKLAEGQVLAVGREAKGVAKLPLTVAFG